MSTRKKKPNAAPTYAELAGAIARYCSLRGLNDIDPNTPDMDRARLDAFAADCKRIEEQNSKAKEAEDRFK